MCVYISIFLYLHIYVHTCIDISMCIYVYIHTHTYHIHIWCRWAFACGQNAKLEICCREEFWVASFRSSSSSSSSSQTKGRLRHNIHICTQLLPCLPPRPPRPSVRSQDEGQSDLFIALCCRCLVVSPTFGHWSCVFNFADAGRQKLRSRLNLSHCPTWQKVTSRILVHEGERRTWLKALGSGGGAFGWM